MKLITNKFFRFNFQKRELILPFSFQLETIIELLDHWYREYQEPKKVAHIKIFRTITDTGLKDAFTAISAIFELDGSWMYFEDTQYAVNNNDGESFYFNEDSALVTLHQLAHNFTLARKRLPQADKANFVRLSIMAGFKLDETLAVIEDATHTN